jgi:hypothetical protein
MGLLWEIVQTGLMYNQSCKADTVEDKMRILEERLEATQNTLRSLVKKIEELHGLDIDNDGRNARGAGYRGRRKDYCELEFQTYSELSKDTDV